jgi:hypothetical protein
MPTGTLEARSTQPLDSASLRDGAPVNAMLTKPLLDPTQQEVILPEGTHLIGSVLQAKPARWFARYGKLRFTFCQIELQPGLLAQEAPAQPSNEIDERLSKARASTSVVYSSRQKAQYALWISSRLLSSALSAIQWSNSRLPGAYLSTSSSTYCLSCSSSRRVWQSICSAPQISWLLNQMPMRRIERTGATNLRRLEGASLREQDSTLYALVGPGDGTRDLMCGPSPCPRRLA